MPFGHTDLAFLALAVNPFGGLLAAIPVAILGLGYPAWLAVVAGVPCAYVQVIAVDLGWTWLERWPAFAQLVERRRSPRVERLVASGGAFLPALVLAPTIGPWLVMAYMRYAHVPQRRVAAPILGGITIMASLTAAACVLVPHLFAP